MCEIFFYLAAASAALGVDPCNNDCVGSEYGKSSSKVQHCMHSCEGFAAALQIPSGSMTFGLEWVPNLTHANVKML